MCIRDSWNSEEQLVSWRVAWADVTNRYLESAGREERIEMCIRDSASEAREDDEDFQNPVDLMFERLEEKAPEHFAVKQYKKYKLAAGKTAKSILIKFTKNLQKRCQKHCTAPDTCLLYTSYPSPPV